MHFLTRFPMFCALLNVVHDFIFPECEIAIARTSWVSKWGIWFRVRDISYISLHVHTRTHFRPHTPIQKHTHTSYMYIYCFYNNGIMVNIISLLNFNSIQFLFVTHRLNPGGHSHICPVQVCAAVKTPLFYLTPLFSSLTRA